MKEKVNGGIKGVFAGS